MAFGVPLASGMPVKPPNCVYDLLGDAGTSL
jgi:hypothetical protein